VSCTSRVRRNPRYFVSDTGSAVIRLCRVRAGYGGIPDILLAIHAQLYSDCFVYEQGTEESRSFVSDTGSAVIRLCRVRAGYGGIPEFC
jgi:hypothetical protein